MMIGAYATYALAERAGSLPGGRVPACLIAAAAGYLSNKAFFRFTRNNLSMVSRLHRPHLHLRGAPCSCGRHAGGDALRPPGRAACSDIGLPKMKLVVFAVIVASSSRPLLGLAGPGWAAAAFDLCAEPRSRHADGSAHARLETAVSSIKAGLAGLGGRSLPSLYSLEPAMGRLRAQGHGGGDLGGIGTFMLAVGGSLILGRHRGRPLHFPPHGPSATRTAGRAGGHPALPAAGLFGDE